VAPEAGQPPRAPRILLVDDEVSGTDVLALVLASEGYHVTVAAEGRHALERLDEAMPDLLVTDFMMPGLNGAELVRKVRSLSAYENLPVLMISGAPEAALRPYGVQYQRFLRKPFSLETFLVAVQALVGAAPR
jgi:CheY-like chemotaxis protein